MNEFTISFFVAELIALIGMMAPIWVSNHKARKGQRCLLRSDMLTIYYHNKEDKKIRQYENENFVMLYEAYKTLGGNSFIDKISKEVATWEVIS